MGKYLKNFWERHMEKKNQRSSIRNQGRVPPKHKDTLGESSHNLQGSQITGKKPEEQGHSLNYKKIRLSDSSLRNWLRKHGKEKYIDFDGAERRQYRDIFKALDGDGSGAIGVEELEDP